MAARKVSPRERLTKRIGKLEARNARQDEARKARNEKIRKLKGKLAKL